MFQGARGKAARRPSEEAAGASALYSEEEYGEFRAQARFQSDDEARLKSQPNHGPYGGARGALRLPDALAEAAPALLWGDGRRVEATGYAADPITGELARAPSEGAAPRTTSPRASPTPRRREAPTSEGGGGVLGRITGLVKGVNERTPTVP